MTKLPHAGENTLLASVFLAFMATAGLFYVNIMAAIVDGLISGLHFSAKDAGLVASANVYGAALGALAAVFAVKGLPWRKAAIVILCLLMAADMASMLVHTPVLLIGIRFVHGLMGGLLVGLSYGVISRTQVPEKVFGVLLVVQFGLGGLGLMYLPRLVPLYGYGVLFLSLAAFSLVALLMVPFLAPYQRPAVDPLAAKTPGDKIKLWPLILTFTAMFTFQAGNMGLAAFIIGLGRDAGLATEPMTNALGWANWIGTAGSALVVVMGIRFGRLLPLLLGLILTLGGTYAFHGSRNLDVYFWANIVTAVTWAFVIPYLLGMCAAFDPQGRMAALGGFFSKMGLASGPLCAALIVNAHLGYGLLIDLTVFVLLISLIATIVPALALDRQRRSQA